jgi:hypothetical protein
MTSADPPRQPLDPDRLWPIENWIRRGAFILAILGLYLLDSRTRAILIGTTLILSIGYASYAASARRRRVRLREWQTRPELAAKPSAHEIKERWIRRGIGIAVFAVAALIQGVAQTVGLVALWSIGWYVGRLIDAFSGEIDADTEYRQEVWTKYWNDLRAAERRWASAFPTYESYLAARDRSRPGEPLSVLEFEELRRPKSA